MKKSLFILLCLLSLWSQTGYSDPPPGYWDDADLGHHDSEIDPAQATTSDAGTTDYEAEQNEEKLTSVQKLQKEASDAEKVARDLFEEASQLDDKIAEAEQMAAEARAAGDTKGEKEANDIAATLSQDQVDLREEADAHMIIAEQKKAEAQKLEAENNKAAAKETGQNASQSVTRDSLPLTSRLITSLVAADKEEIQEKAALRVGNTLQRR